MEIDMVGIEHNSGKKAEQGFALIEALISFLILAVGLISLLSFNSASQRSLSEAKSQAEAVALAEQKLQELESFLSVGDARLSDGSYSEHDIAGLITSFDMDWVVATDASDSTQKNARVTVTWDDRDGNEQQVILSSEIYFRDPGEKAQDFIVAMNEVRESTSGDDYVWGTPDGQGGQETDGDATGGETGDVGDGDTGDTGENTDTDTVFQIVVISGSVDVAGNGTQFNGVSASNSNYPVVCEHTSTSYTCTSGQFAVAETLTVKLTFLTNKVVCEPESGYYQFNNVDSDITSGYEAVIRKNSGDCP
jgi:Tfp pilus assembly protein PilE